MVSAGASPVSRAEGEFALARPEFDFERAQRQAERDEVACAEQGEDRIELIEARFGEILKALREQAHLRRLAGGQVASAGASRGFSSLNR